MRSITKVHRLTQKNGLREGGRSSTGVSEKLPAIDDHGLIVAITVTIVIPVLPDHHSVITAIALTNDFPLAIAVVRTVPDGDTHAGRTNAHTYADFLCAGRHGKTDSGSRDGHHCKTLHHVLAPEFELSERQCALP